jgi:hypothetical protein
MAIITCSAREDGTLVPSAVQFEPGDYIRLNSDEPSKAILVKGSFTLDSVSAKVEDGVARLGVGAATELFSNVHFPPPGGAGTPPTSIHLPPRPAPVLPNKPEL